MDKNKTKNFSFRKAGRIMLKTLLWVVVFFMVVVLLIQTPPVQSYIRKKTVVWLQEKLDTRVEVDRIYVGLPKNVVLEKVYLEDRNQDTLLYGGKVLANINLFDLIFRNEIDFSNIELRDMTAKVKRELPDTVFNFQFILDEFASGGSTTPADSSSATAISIGKVSLDNIRLIYKDAVTGSDMEAWIDHLDTKMKRFDPGNMDFAAGKLNIHGLNARVYQTKPLVTPEPIEKDLEEATAPISLQLNVDELDLENIILDYRNDVSQFYADVNLGKLFARPEGMDVMNTIVSLDEFRLENTTAAIRLGKTIEAKQVEEEVEKEIETRAEAGWKIKANSIVLRNNNLRFDNDNSTPVNRGMDYAHLDVKDLDLEIDNLMLSVDSIAGNIRGGSFTEKSGFVLNELKADALYTSNGASLKNLYLKTPGTEIRQAMGISYASLESLQQSPANMEVDLDLLDSKVLVSDILTFAPQLRNQPAFAGPNTTWYVDSRITGKLSDLHIDRLTVSGLRNTSIDISGNIGGMPDMNALAADLDIRHIRTTRKDLETILPRNSIPQNINLPTVVNVKGSVRGNPSALRTNVSVKTDLGNANVNGIFSQLADPDRINYDAEVETNSFSLARLLRDEQLPSGISANISMKGTGVNPETANATFKGVIHSAQFQGYNYRNLSVDGSIANQVANFETSMTDPNIHFAMIARSDLSGEFPSLQLKGNIDSIKFKNLNLTPNDMIYRGKIDASLTNTNPDALEGRVDLIQSLLVLDEQRLQLDTARLQAGVSDTGRFLTLNSEVMYAKLEGDYQLSNIGTILQHAIDPYFSIIPSTRDTITEPYDFTIDAYVLDNPALKVFIPGLTRIDSVTIASHFSNSGWNAEIDAPAIDMGINKLRSLHLVAGTGQDDIDLFASMDMLASGESFQLHNTTIRANIANNSADFVLNIKDRLSKDKYNIHALLNQPVNGRYELLIQPDRLMLNYDPWTISPGSKITFGEAGINADDVILSKNGQSLTINSHSALANAPLDLSFSEFELGTLTGLVQTDTTLAQGRMNGKITFTDLANAPVFIGDLTINDLLIRKDTVGDVRIQGNNSAPNTYFADVTLTGRGNDVQITGNYYVRPGSDSYFDLDLDMRTMQLSSAQAFTGGAIRDASGAINGRFKVTGNFQQPVVSGDLNFDKTRFNFAMLNTYFSVDKEKIRVDRQGVHFDRFQVRDSANNPLTIDGLAATKNFSNYDFDLTLRARNFKMLSSTKKDNDIFYGHLYFDTDLTLKGTEALPRIEGRIIVNENTRMTVVLPQREPGVVSREGIIEFIDFDAPINDSLFLAPYDSLNTAKIFGADISINAEINPEAEFNLILDEGNGDFLNVKGEALLNAGIDPSGKVTLSGSYELEEGAYELTFNFIRRRFEIESGSRIVWQGEPTDATVDVTAKYVAEAAPLDLVKNQIGDVEGTARNIYLQKLPFEVTLMMEGELLKPMISFDIVLPEGNYLVSNDVLTNTRMRLDQLRQEEAEMNKQVFSLLLLNRFVAENPFNSSGSGPTVGTLARQSVSKLLTEQLNRLADDLVAGVNLDFDIISSEDYTTGERRDRTDLNVGLSKRLLNDRLTVSIGSNFELEGPRNSTYNASNIAGNIAVDYQLSKDKRYVLRAYRKNEYEGIIDGYIIETGVGFIITLDYNKFSQIFRKKRNRRSAERTGNREQ